VDRLRRWRETGTTALVAAGSAGQADKLRRLMSERRLHVKVRKEPLPEDPRSLWEPSVHAHLVTEELSSGFAAPDHGFAIVTDEEILGPRQRRKLRTSRRADLPFVASFREL